GAVVSTKSELLAPSIVTLDIVSGAVPLLTIVNVFDTPAPTVLLPKSTGTPPLVSAVPAGCCTTSCGVGGPAIKPNTCNEPWPLEMSAKRSPAANDPVFTDMATLLLEKLLSPNWP